MTFTITTTPDGLGGAWVHAGPVRLGRVFPARYTPFPDPQPVAGCRWFGWRTGIREDARPFDTEHEALRYVSAGQETP